MIDWLLDFGYLGLFIGTFLAGTVLPLSSDFLFVGMLTAGGSVWLCHLSATTGNWLGALTCYWLGRAGKWEWLDKWFGIKKEKLARQKTVINKYGVFVALFSWLPFIGTLSVIALGFYKVKPKTTTLLLYIGCFLRYLVWVLLYIKYGEMFVEWIKAHIG